MTTKRERQKQRLKRKARNAKKMRVRGAIVSSVGAVVLEARRTADAQREQTDQLAAMHSSIEAEIDEHVRAVLAIVPNFDSLDLLHRAYSDFLASAVGKTTEQEVEFDDGVCVRMLDYIQSIIVSIKPADETRPLDAAAWDGLRAHVSRIYELLLGVWPSTYTAAQRTAPGYSPDDDLDAEFRIPLLIEWLAVRGSRYTIHERERAFAFLAPHDDLLVRLFGVGAEAIADAVEEIHTRLSKSLLAAMRTVLEIHAETFADRAVVEEITSQHHESEQGFARALAARTGRLAELDAAIEAVCGRQLFDVSELLPRRLLESISLAPGTDAALLAPGAYRGWPLRTPPISRRPILRVDDRFFVFNPYGMDNFYRAIERAVMEVEPTARESWNEGQKRATETFPVEILKSLLPGARVFTDVFYPYSHESGETRWCECDAVIALDTLVLAIEVKGGRATDVSPFESSDQHLRSIQQLLHAPAKQGDRFLRYLQSASEVVLYDSNHDEVGRLRHADFERQVRCAISADSMASVAGNFQHTLEASGEAVPPTWCLSVDDLLVYRDTLTTPAALYHFLQYRLEAFGMKELSSWDELDHLGAYLDTNAYTQRFAELNATKIFATYRAHLDEYFLKRWAEEEAEPPTQPLPDILEQILVCLETTRPNGWLSCSAQLLDLDGETRQRVATQIAIAGIGLEQGTSRVVCGYAGHRSPVFIGVRHSDTSRAEVAETNRDHAMSQLVIANDPSGVLLDVALENGQVVEASCERLTIRLLPAARQRQLARLADAIAARRFRRAAANGEMPRDSDPCLCGRRTTFGQCCRKRVSIAS